MSESDNGEPFWAQACSVCDHVWRQTTDPMFVGDELCPLCGADADPAPLHHEPGFPGHEDCAICRRRGIIHAN